MPVSSSPDVLARVEPVGDALSVPWPWTLVLPVKGGPTAKSRLGPLGEQRRAGLARAIALDTVEVVLACARAVDVVVVSGADEVGAEVRRLGARTVRDPGAGLDAAVTAGIAAAPAHRPCAVLLPDLPALRPSVLARALDACARALGDGAAAAVVPDADGTGTVLLAGGHPAALRPRFGAGSAARHAVGARTVEASLRLRRDVDTAEHLAVALGLGVGPRTALAAAGLALPG